MDVKVTVSFDTEAQCLLASFADSLGAIAKKNEVASPKDGAAIIAEKVEHAAVITTEKKTAPQEQAQPATEHLMTSDELKAERNRCKDMGVKLVQAEGAPALRKILDAAGAAKVGTMTAEQAVLVGGMLDAWVADHADA